MRLSPHVDHLRAESRGDTARGFARSLRASRKPVTKWLQTATDEDLLEPRPSHLGQEKTAGEVVGILLDEQTHHGAEIALLRDLYLRRGDDSGVL